jgi:DNA transposition AAA+ family ATPase
MDSLTKLPHHQLKDRSVEDPTMLIVVDEADRLHMNSLEQIKSIFDEGISGLMFICMPGIGKRITRFPQFYSHIGFVHEFRCHLPTVAFVQVNCVAISMLLLASANHKTSFPRATRT